MIKIAIFRINKTTDFTAMSNHHLKNKSLSLKAKGLLSMMLALPDDWEFSISGLVSLCKENETAVKSALDELKDAGYVKVDKILPNETQSKKIEYIYNIYEKPINKSDDEQGIGFQPLENQPLENQPLENQPLENHTLLNTNILNTNIYNTKRKYIKEKVYDENLFNLFWEAYPKKKSKGDAEKWFKKNRPSEELVHLMIDKLACLKNTNSWRKDGGQYIPYPATWLNAKGWEDEVESTCRDLNPLWENIEADLATPEELEAFERKLRGEI